MPNLKRAAIVTPYGLFNYGNRLQNFAVDHILRKRGLEVETLILKPSYPGPSLRDIALHAGHTLGLRGRISQKYRAFHRFDRPLRKRRVWGLRHLRALGATYDLVICGSDQIWNRFRSDLGGAEYANFAPHARKIALSPSFGVETLPQAAKEQLRSRLERFHSLSVREYAGQRIIHESTGREVAVLIDPTMSLSATEWRRLASSRMKPHKPYLFVYLLGNYGPEVMEAVNAEADSRGLEVVTLMRRDLPEYLYAGPQDFLGLIDGSSGVIADSFHAAVFSLLFEKEFRLVERTGNQSMHSRFDTLAALFNLEFRPAEGLPWNLLGTPDSLQFKNRLANHRAAFQDFIDHALTGL